MLSISQIHAVCEKHKSNKFFVDPIPHVQLHNACISLKIPPKERVIGLADLTVFGSCKDAIAFCSGGIYIKNLSSRDVLTWGKFQNLNFEYTGFFSSKVKFSNGMLWDFTGGDSQIIPLVFRDLKDLSNEIYSEDATIKWYVVFNQEQFGPYETESLIKLIEDGQLNPEIILVWREGMTEWIPYKNVRELNSRPFNPPQFLPPTQHKTAKMKPQTERSTTKALYPMVDLNNSSLDDLLLLPGITLTSGKQLIYERKERLGFQTIEEVGELLDLPPHKVQRIRELALLRPYLESGPGTSARRRVIDF